MYKSKMAADICFIVGQPGGQVEEILAHKYVLISRSPVFEAMLSPTWTVQAPGQDITKVEVPDILPKVFHEMLRYFDTLIILLYFCV